MTNDGHARRLSEYKRHTCNGRTDRGYCVFWDGDGKRRQKHFPGAYGSDESVRAYHTFARRLIDGIDEQRRNRPAAADDDDPVTVGEVVARFLLHAKAHYVKDGVPTGEADNFVLATKPLLRLYRDLPARDFGPKKLRLVRKDMEESAKLSRRTINQRVQKIRHVFKWGGAEELVPGSVLENLKTLSGLQPGRTEAHEPGPVDPVPAKDLAKTLRQLTPSLAVMVRVQVLTGMRPDELLQMRGADITRKGGIWTYKPRRHKTMHLGKPRVVAIGPKAQRFLEPYLERMPTALLFTPRQSEAERKRAMRAARQSKVPPSQQERARRSAENPRRVLRDEWTVAAYRRALHYAADRAGVPRWGPNRLRHNFEDRAERRLGLEAASKALGHSTLATTEHYRHKRDLTVAVEVAQRIG